MNAKFEFASGNLRALLRLPGYVLATVAARCVPRVRGRWIFGSGVGVGEGTLEVARVLRADDPDAHIVWVVGDTREAELAAAEHFQVVFRRSWAGFWQTLRAEYIVISHGFGDVNRFGVFGARIIHLGHGAPLKRVHLDSSVTTRLRGTVRLRALLQRMYRASTKQVALYVAGSVTAAERLRSAYRVDPGRVLVLGDPRDESLCARVRAPDGEQRDAVARETVRQLVRLPGDEQGGEEQDDSAPSSRERFVLYAPTWRDGEADPAIPTPEEARVIRAALTAMNVRLFIRSHPLGYGSYEHLLGDRVHLFGSELTRNLTPMLGAFDAIITDYSSIAVDFSLLERPIIWFAPDLEHYIRSRGLYEPLEVTAAGQIVRTWEQLAQRLATVLRPGSIQHRRSIAHSRDLAARFHAYPEGGAAHRVITQAKRLAVADADRVAAGAVFFESFYGRQVSCNPLALDREIAQRLPNLPRYWSVTSERMRVPEGAKPLLLGSPDWFAARRMARLLIVNDWLRYRFRRGRHQTVLQTWHGTMLKRLALERRGVSVRTGCAIRRESRRWSLLLSQNSHSSERLRASYAFRGEILETGYPRADRLAAAVTGGARISIAVDTAKRALGIDPTLKVLAYLPTWRERRVASAALDVQQLVRELGREWVVVTRGHTRSVSAHGCGSFAVGVGRGSDEWVSRVVDASAHPDVNDLILAADVLVTDYSSVMFDAAVARVPMLFFVPDLDDYRDRERGFTFDFAATAPGPLLSTLDQLVAAVRDAALAEQPHSARYQAWCERYTSHDDGRAAARVVDELIRRGAL